MKNTKNIEPRNITRRKFLEAMGMGAAVTLGGCDGLAPLLEVPNLKRTVVSPPDFDVKKAGENLSIALLPLIYEEEHIEGNISHDGTLAMIRSRLPKNAEFKVFRHGHTTAVVVNNPDKKSITVAYDASIEAKDKLNNLNILPHTLALGNVHSGYFNSITSVDKEGISLCDRVKAQVEEYAAKQSGETDLTLTGFSRGGALAMTTAAMWFTEGLPKNARLTHMQTFGSPPLGDQEFVNNFVKKCEEKGIEFERVIAGNDIVPRHMSGEIWWQIKIYPHAGKAIYLLPDAAILVNPTPETLKKHSAKLPELDWHNTDTYASLLGTQEAYMAYSEATKRTAVEVAGHKAAITKRAATAAEGRRGL